MQSTVSAGPVSAKIVRNKAYAHGISPLCSSDKATHPLDQYHETWWTHTVETQRRDFLLYFLQGTRRLHTSLMPTNRVRYTLGTKNTQGSSSGHPRNNTAERQHPFIALGWLFENDICFWSCFHLQVQSIDLLIPKRDLVQRRFDSPQCGAYRIFNGSVGLPSASR